MTYKENLRKTAEELCYMAPDTKCFRWEGCGMQFNDFNQFIGLAEYCLKKRAEEVEAALLQCGWHQAGIRDYLIDRGLIPTPERKEAGEV